MVNECKRQINEMKPYTFTKGQLWDLFTTLAAINAEGIREFKKINTNSHPAEFAEEKDGHEHWHRILDQMIWSFEQIKRNYPDDPYNEWFDATYNTTESLKHVLDDDKRAPKEVLDNSNAYYQKVQDGINLYAKYFQSLWD